jgi:hypothetical protein
MKALYKSGETMIIKIKADLVYYGNGESINAFGETAAQFLRYNPYMTDVSEKEITIPEAIKNAIKSHKNNE